MVIYRKMIVRRWWGRTSVCEDLIVPVALGRRCDDGARTLPTIVLLYAYLNFELPHHLTMTTLLHPSVEKGFHVVFVLAVCKETLMSHHVRGLLAAGGMIVRRSEQADTVPDPVP